MNAHKKAIEYLEQPGNRPPGIPNNARFAAVAVAIFCIIVEGFFANYLIYINKSHQLLVGGEPLLFILVTFFMIMFYGLRSGNLIFIKFFSYFLKSVYLLYFLNWALSLFQYFYYNDIRNGLAVSNILLLALISPFIYLMHRALKRSRWLDPKSLPHEWEIPAINDPTSISYRPPKNRADPNIKHTTSGLHQSEELPKLPNRSRKCRRKAQ